LGPTWSTYDLCERYIKSRNDEDISLLIHLLHRKYFTESPAYREINRQIEEIQGNESDFWRKILHRLKELEMALFAFQYHEARMAQIELLRIQKQIQAVQHELVLLAHTAFYGIYKRKSLEKQRRNCMMP
jgi:hypothetical protein